MVARYVFGTSIALLALVAGINRLAAQEESSRDAARGHEYRIDALMDKLGLNDQQREQVRKIRTDFDKKEEPIEKQLWTLHQEECQALQSTLNEQQRKELPNIMRDAWNKEFQKVAEKLNLTSDQKQRVEKIRDEYQPKFMALMQSKGSEDAFKQFHDLREQAHKQVREVLNDDQRARFPTILREEFHKWHEQAFRQQFVKDLAQKLGLSNDQRDKLQKECADSNKKIEQTAGQLKKLHHEEFAAMEKVLTADQRQKLEQWEKSK